MIPAGRRYEYYPAIDFGIQGTSVDYSSECGQSGDYLSELFRIPTAEDRIEVTLERDQAGDFISCAWERIPDSGSAVVADAPAFGETGCYYAFCLEDAQTGKRAMANHMFPRERACLFDGERLVLAAFEDWNSLNVLLAVYDRDGEAYSGLYRHSGTQDELYGMDWNRMRPQGRENYSFLEERYLMDVYVRGTGEEVKALELCPAKDFTREGCKAGSPGLY